MGQALIGDDMLNSQDPKPSPESTATFTAILWLGGGCFCLAVVGAGLIARCESATVLPAVTALTVAVAGNKKNARMGF